MELKRKFITVISIRMIENVYAPVYTAKTFLCYNLHEPPPF